MKNPGLPELYVYMYRNILRMANSYHYITEEELFLSFKRVVHTAPNCVYENVIQDLINWKLIDRANAKWYLVLHNKIAMRKLKKLKNFAFPF